MGGISCSAGGDRITEGVAEFIARGLKVKPVAKSNSQWVGALLD